MTDLKNINSLFLFTNAFISYDFCETDCNILLRSILYSGNCKEGSLTWPDINFLFVFASRQKKREFIEKCLQVFVGVINTKVAHANLKKNQVNFLTVSEFDKNKIQCKPNASQFIIFIHCAMQSPLFVSYDRVCVCGGDVNVNENSNKALERYPLIKAITIFSSFLFFEDLIFRGCDDCETLLNENLNVSNLVQNNFAISSIDCAQSPIVCFRFEHTPLIMNHCGTRLAFLSYAQVLEFLSFLFDLKNRSAIHTNWSIAEEREIIASLQKTLLIDAFFTQCYFSISNSIAVPDNENGMETTFDNNNIRSVYALRQRMSAALYTSLQRLPTFFSDMNILLYGSNSCRFFLSGNSVYDSLVDKLYNKCDLWGNEII